MQSKTNEEDMIEREGDYNDEDMEDIGDDVSTYDIAVFYNTYNLNILLDEMDEESLIVPGYQRAFVWDQKKASEFIDSLLRKLPVPAFFIYDDIKNNKKLIVDGQQRLKSLYSFIRTEIFNDRDFLLIGNVHKDWKGLKFSQLDIELQKHLTRTLLNCTIMRQVMPDDEHSSMYLVFQRINTGGIVLTPQEIRMTVSHGPFSTWLSELAENKVFAKWDFLRPKKERDNNNFQRLQELIVRMMALYFEPESYNGSMRKFIDNFFDRNKNFDIKKQKSIKTYSQVQLEAVFTCVLQELSQLTSETFIPKNTPTTAFFEAVWIGLIHRKLVLKKTICTTNLKKHIENWKNIEGEKNQNDFANAFHARRSTSKESVNLRIELAKKYFAQDF